MFEWRIVKFLPQTMYGNENNQRGLNIHFLHRDMKLSTDYTSPMRDNSQYVVK